MTNVDEYGQQVEPAKPMTGRAKLVTWLLLAAAALLVVGFVLWHKASTDAEDARITNEFSCALSRSLCEDDPGADRMPATIAFIGAGFLGLSGVIIGATTQRP